MFKRLEKWLKDRKFDCIEYDHLTLIGCINEEIKEGIDKRDDLHESIDWRCDCIIYLINSITQSGYNAEKCLYEALKEIESREQDPKQKKEWDFKIKNNIKIKEKWKKNKNQKDETKYKADYESCRLLK
ncbi:TPA: hypothetical protein ACICD0_001385 [Campylobacter jejuni]